jgi:hypothetical protein
MRTLYDDDGKAWRVWRVTPQSHVLKSSSPTMHGGWLCFESDGDKRRLAEPPANWEELSEGDLRALFARAAPVRRAMA